MEESSSLFKTKFIFLPVAHSSGSLRRSIHIGELHDTAKSKPKLDQYGFYGEIGVDVPFAKVLIQPFIGFEGDRFFSHGDKEENSFGLGLQINKEKWSSSWGRLGVHMSTNWEELEVSLDLAWDRLLSKKKNRAEGKFISFGNEYTICGVPLNDNGIDYSLTFSKHLEESLTFYIELSGESWSKAYSINGIAGIEMSW